MLNVVTVYILLQLSFTEFLKKYNEIYNISYQNFLYQFMNLIDKSIPLKLLGLSANQKQLSDFDIQKF